jgi:hypothetical protein
MSPVIRKDEIIVAQQRHDCHRNGLLAEAGMRRSTEPASCKKRQQTLLEAPDQEQRFERLAGWDDEW